MPAIALNAVPVPIPVRDHEAGGGQDLPARLTVKSRRQGRSCAHGVLRSAPGQTAGPTALAATDPSRPASSDAAAALPSVAGGTSGGRERAAAGTGWRAQRPAT